MGEWPFFKVSDMNRRGNERELSIAGNWVSTEQLREMGARTWPAGTVVFPKVGAALLTEKRRLLVRKGAFDNNVMGLVAGPDVLPGFLMLVMERIRLGGLAQRGAVPSVNQAIVGSIEILLPAIAEQRRIVDLVRAVADVWDLTNREMECIELVRVFLAETLMANPEFAMQPLATLDAAGTLTDGDWIETKDQSRAGIRLLQLADIGIGRFLDKSDRYISPATFDRLGCHQVLPGDILMSRMADPIGRACVAPDTVGRMITAVDVAILRLGHGHVPSYWLSVLNTPSWWRKCDISAGGSTRRRISRKRMEELPVPIPPSDVQARFGHVFQALGTMRDALRGVLAATDLLRTSLLDDLLAGAHEIPESYDRFLGAV